jgi:hypothetical protein
VASIRGALFFFGEERLQLIRVPISFFLSLTPSFFENRRVKRPSPTRIIVSLALLGASAWAMFHPPMKADLAEIDPVVLKQIEALGFKSVASARSIQYSGSEISREYVDRYNVELSNVAKNQTISERRVTRSYPGQVFESITLTFGNFPLLHLERPRPPLVWGLLPYTFWGKTKLTKLEIIEHNGYPTRERGTIKLRTTYEHLYADGSFDFRETVLMTCTVATIVPANQVLKSETGQAAQVECSENVEGTTKIADEPEKKPVGNNRTTYSSIVFIEAHTYLNQKREWKSEFEHLSNSGSQTSNFTGASFKPL